jgi:hypothetical protein
MPRGGGRKARVRALRVHVCAVLIGGWRAGTGVKVALVLLNFLTRMHDGLTHAEVAAARVQLTDYQLRCETRKTKLSVPSFGDYLLLKNGRQ